MSALCPILAVLLTALLGASTASATVITSAADPALAGSLLQTFDSEASGDFATRDFLVGLDGFSINPVSGSMQIETAWCDDFGTTNNCIGTNSAGGANDDFDLVFTGSGVSAFGFVLNALDVDWTVQTYSASDTLLGTYNIADQGATLSGFDRRGFFGATEVVPIKYIEVRSASGDDWALIDDFRYTLVPEPSTAVLAGLGLIALSMTGRKDRRA